MKNKTIQPLLIIPIQDIPDISPGDDIARIIAERIQVQGDVLVDNDILVITQKVISKAEDRFVNISTIKPSRKAKRIGRVSGKNPALVELIMRESNRVLRYNDRSIIVEHKLGFVCANAGIDHSNVGRGEQNAEDWVLLLPADPDATAEKIRKYIENKYHIHVGVMIIDSHGRAWRYGTVGTMIGVSGMPALVDLRGTPDLYGRALMITRVGAADELAGAASLVMGQSAERIPAVIARGFPYALREASLSEIIRSSELDLFRK